MQDISKAVLTFLIIITVTTVIHWSLVQIYALWCAPKHLSGILTTFLTLGSPFCQFMNYIQFELAKHYIGIWTTAGIAIIAYLTGRLTT